MIFMLKDPDQEKGENLKEKILVVGAHPHDVDFTCAGTMIKWASEWDI